MRLQKTLRDVHRWLGVVFGALIAMMALSGVILVFRQQLESSATPKMVSGPVNLTAIEQTFKAAHRDARLNRVTFPTSSGDPVLLQMETAGRGRLQLFFDPVSGRELGPKQTLAWLDWVVDLHQNLLLGTRGRALTGVIGIALFLISLTGLLSWLSGRRNWKRAFALPAKGPWRRIHYDAHRWAGLWANLLMLGVSFTGVVLAYPKTFESIIEWAGDEHPLSHELRGKGEAPRERAPLERYVAAAGSVVSAGVVREIRLPGRGGGAVSVTLWTPWDVRPKGGSTVVLDPATSEVVSADLASDSPFSRRFVEVSNAVHKTELGGLPVKLAWSFFGLAPLFLFFSGARIWWLVRQTGVRRASGRKALPKKIFSGKVSPA